MDKKWTEQEIQVAFGDKHASIDKITDRQNEQHVNNSKNERIGLHYIDKMGVERRVNAYYETNGITKTLIFENELDEAEIKDDDGPTTPSNPLNHNYMGMSGDIDLENQI